MHITVLTMMPATSVCGVSIRYFSEKERVTVRRAVMPHIALGQVNGFSDNGKAVSFEYQGDGAKKPDGGEYPPCSLGDGYTLHHSDDRTKVVYCDLSGTLHDVAVINHTGEDEPYSVCVEVDAHGDVF